MVITSRSRFDRFGSDNTGCPIHCNAMGGMFGTNLVCSGERFELKLEAVGAEG